MTIDDFLDASKSQASTLAGAVLQPWGPEDGLTRM